ncbi:MAG: molecular chaperone DnaJ [Lachnospiraceae bacterium]|nr:molecular chaperone DnaJ [Lachnospiraceae bacterium]
MTDPYQVLGISRNASDDEVKKAYRDLSRKYHPDSYVDNPLANLAEEKFKEVQEAYDQIMNERANGGSYSQNTYGGGSNSYYDYSSSGNSREMAEVVSLINGRRFHEALNSLQRMSERSSRWYYYSAVANAGLGNNFEAMNQARQACSMEPGNVEYSNFLNQLQWGGNMYRQRGQNYGRTSDAGDLCCNLLIADTCCECMGGDLCSCI